MVQRKRTCDQIIQRLITQQATTVNNTDYDYAYVKIQKENWKMSRKLQERKLFCHLS